MAIPHAKSGEVIDIRPLGTCIGTKQDEYASKVQDVGNHSLGDSLGKGHS